MAKSKFKTRIINFPSEFDLLGNKIKIVICHQVNDDGRMGEADYEKNIIRIRYIPNADIMMATLYHEIVHFFLFYALHGESHDEKVVDLLASMFHQFTKTKKEKRLKVLAH